MTACRSCRRFSQRKLTISCALCGLLIVKVNRKDSARTAQPQIKRALAAVAHMRFLEPDDKGAEFRQRKPHRYLTTQYAALAPTLARRGAFAGDDERDLRAFGLGPAQEAQQRDMRLILRHAMQVDPGIDGVAAARHALLEPAVKRRERGRF